jgi:hypothetical protein
MRVVRSIVLLSVGLMGGLAAAAVAAKHALPARGDSESDEVGLVAIFDGVNLRSRARAFRGGSALAWFGGVSLDLREAELAPDARLTVGAMCGGVALRVPPGWRVETAVRAIAGGVEVAEAEPDDPSAPVLVIDGLALMGGVAVGRKSRSAES